MADSMRVRIAIGLPLIGAIVGLLAADRATGHAWGVVTIAVLLVGAGLVEFGRLAQSVGPVPTAGLALAGAVTVAIKGLAYELDPRLHALVPAVAVACAYALFFRALRGAPDGERLRGLTATVFGFVYVAFLGGFALDVRFLPGVGEAGFFYVVAIAKGTDICAYFAGKLLGKTKVVPSVSPGKTVAGFVGAVLGGAGITCLFAAFSPLGAAVPLPLAPGVGALMALVVISGDLIESFIKRAAAVKDSAALLPNFGGVLDIVDSVVIAAPPVYFLLAGLTALRGGPA